MRKGACPARRRLRGLRRAGETPAHPGPAFGGVGVCAFVSALRCAETCGQDARGPGPRLRRGWGLRFRVGAALCGNVRAGCPRSRAPPSAGLGFALFCRRCVVRRRAGRMPAVPGPAFGGVGVCAFVSALRCAETCGQDARGPGPRLRRGWGLRFSAGAALCGNVRAGCPRSRAPPSAGFAPAGPGSSRPWWIRLPSGRGRGVCGRRRV